MPVLHFLLQSARFSFRVDDDSGAVSIQFHPQTKPLCEFKSINHNRKPAMFQATLLNPFAEPNKVTSPTLNQINVPKHPVTDEQDSNNYTNPFLPPSDNPFLPQSDNPYLPPSDKTKILQNLVSPLRSAGLVDDGICRFISPFKN